MKVCVDISTESNPQDAGRHVASAIRDGIGSDSVDLAFLFFSSHYAEDTEMLVNTIQQNLSPKVLVGCMGEGVIGKTEEFEGTPVVTVWAANLPEVDLIPFHLTFDESRNEGSQIQGWPDHVSTGVQSPTIFLLADPFSTSMKALFAQIEQRCPGAPVIGGVASGGNDLGGNRLILNGNVLYGGVVGLAISGAISIRTVVSQGCRPIGDRYVVTKADRNIIYELGGVPTLERLQATLDALGSAGGRQAAMALQLGVVCDEHQTRFDLGDFLIRGLIGADQNSGGVAVSDIVQEGQTVQFHLRDASVASEELNLLLARDRINFPDEVPQGALLFSCNGRGRRFFTQPHHDINTVRNQVGRIPVAGFFAAGEFGPVGGQNFIHGYTASIALFSEPKAIH